MVVLTLRTSAPVLEPRGAAKEPGTTRNPPFTLEYEHKNWNTHNKMHTPKYHRKIAHDAANISNAGGGSARVDYSFACPRLRVLINKMGDHVGEGALSAQPSDTFSSLPAFPPDGGVEEAEP